MRKAQTYSDSESRSSSGTVSLIVAVVALAVWVLLNISHYQILRDEALSAGEARVAEVLRIQSAIHRFVESDQKPAVYSLMSEGELGADWFDPRILSGTYIARRIQEEVNGARLAQGWSGIDIKLAAIDARNPMNEANAAEAELLKRFNSGEIDELRELRERNGLTYFYAAIPMFRNGVACMRCHGKPEEAPQDLIEQYGDERAFGRTLGEIPALISVEVPMEAALGATLRDNLVYAGGSGFLIGSAALLVIGFSRRLDAKNRELDQLSRRDPLTALYNRRVFNESLDQEIDRARRYGSALTMVIADIDFFKRINDTHGHLTGDKALIAFAHMLERQSRQSDLVARWGGEEFISLLPGSDLDAGARHAEIMRAATEDISIGDNVSFTASFGVVQWRGGETSTELLSRLDRTLYRAKAGGRNRVEVDGDGNG